MVRYEQAIKFFRKCRDASVFPKFTRWKIINGKSEKIKSKYRRKILLDEIRAKNDLLRNLKEQLQNETTELYQNITYMKKWMIKYSIENIVKQEERLVEKRHDKKFGDLLKEKHEVEGTTNNPNKTIWNFSSHTLENEEFVWVVLVGVRVGVEMLLV